MEKYNPVTHVIFDLDGLLLGELCDFTFATLYKRLLDMFELILFSFTDTESLYYKLDGQICEKYGKQFTKKIKQKVLGTTAFRSAEIIVEELNLPVTVQDYVDQMKEMQLKELGDVDIMPGNCVISYVSC